MVVVSGLSRMGGAGRPVTVTAAGWPVPRSPGKRLRAPCRGGPEYSADVAVAGALGRAAWLASVRINTPIDRACPPAAASA